MSKQICQECGQTLPNQKYMEIVAAVGIDSNARTALAGVKSTAQIAKITGKSAFFAMKFAKDAEKRLLLIRPFKGVWQITKPGMTKLSLMRREGWTPLFERKSKEEKTHAKAS